MVFDERVKRSSSPPHAATRSTVPDNPLPGTGRQIQPRDTPEVSPKRRRPAPWMIGLARTALRPIGPRSAWLWVA